MVNRKTFFDIFFYNKEQTRELLEVGEEVWRAYKVKYGLGLDASASGEPTYEEVREITYMANFAVQMVADQAAEEEAKEAARKKAAMAAWEVPEEPVVEIAEEPAAEVTEEAAAEAAEEAIEETAEEIAEEAIEEAAEEVAEEVMEEAAEEVTEEIVEEAAEEVTEEAGEEEPARVIRLEKKAAEEVRTPVKPTRKAGAACDISLWVEDLIYWCQSKGMQCIKTHDDGDFYLHVYLPYKKEVHPVGKWCFKENTNGADLAAEMTKLYAYCEGFADCFERLMK